MEKQVYILLIFWRKSIVNKAVIYIQCDARYNSILLEKVGDNTVIRQTIELARKIGPYRIITSVFECDENILLIKELNQINDVKLIKSKEENVTKRFLNTVLNEKGFVIRICGDQMLLKPDMMKSIFEEMEENYDLFYEDGNAASMLGDIVSVDLLNKYKAKIENAERYFLPLIEDNSIRRFRKMLPTLGHNCRANNYLNYIFCKSVVENHLDVYELQNDLLGRMGYEKGDLYQSGIWTSWFLGSSSREFFYNISGQINPWWCEAAVNLTEDKIKDYHNLKIFEWGAGNSTLFFAKYAEKVISIEYDRTWYEKILRKMPRNVEVRLYELVYDGLYCRAINEQEELFDIILIDGRDRNRCAINCVSKLKPNGIIIWDNSDREYYREGIDFLTSQGFRSLELSGAVYGIPENIGYTRFFYKDNNFWNI